jgi:hypothetical protein
LGEEARRRRRPCNCNCHRIGHRFRDENLKAVQKIQHPAHTDESRQLGGHGPGFQSFHGAFGDAALPGQLRLSQIALQPDALQPPTQFGEHRIIGGLFCDLHNNAKYGE